MKDVTVYHKETGVILKQLTANNEDDLASKVNIPDDHIYIEGHHDPRTHRIDVVTCRPVAYVPEQLPTPSSHGIVEVRQKITELETRQSRVVREMLLGAEGGRERLQAIDDEIAALRKDLGP